MSRDGIEVALLQVKGGVGLAQILAFVGDGSAKSRREKRFLFRSLLVHVHVVEEVVHAFVGQNLHIKQFHGCIDRRLAAKSVINAVWFCLRLNGFLLLDCDATDAEAKAGGNKTEAERLDDFFHVGLVVVTLLVSEVS